MRTKVRNSRIDKAIKNRLKESSDPLNSTFELAGPESIRQDDLVRQFLDATGDARTVVADPKALYYGVAVNDRSLVPGDHPRLGPTHFADWLSSQAMAVT